MRKVKKRFQRGMTKLCICTKYLNLKKNFGSYEFNRFSENFRLLGHINAKQRVMEKSKYQIREQI